jgi:hypothetical protein
MITVKGFKIRRPEQMVVARSLAAMDRPIDGRIVGDGLLVFVFLVFIVTINNLWVWRRA